VGVFGKRKHTRKEKSRNYIDRIGEGAAQHARFLGKRQHRNGRGNVEYMPWRKRGRRKRLNESLFQCGKRGVSAHPRKGSHPDEGLRTKKEGTVPLQGLGITHPSQKGFVAILMIKREGLTKLPSRKKKSRRHRKKDGSPHSHQQKGVLSRRSSWRKRDKVVAGLNGLGQKREKGGKDAGGKYTPDLRQ